MENKQEEELKKIIINLLEKDKIFKHKIQRLLEIDDLEFELNLLKNKYNVLKS